mmetsp:Transcript_31442/g.62132  ORF Transcript_31442/g.62132 Transcript_31442/m.62132 type:complete len:306 (+) Transcript_31442:1149-2066(+)
MDGKSSHTLLNTASDACTSGEGEHLNGPLCRIMNLLDEVHVALQSRNFGSDAGLSSSSCFEVNACLLLLLGGGGRGIGQLWQSCLSVQGNSNVLKHSLRVRLQLLFVLLTLLLLRSLASVKTERAAVVQRGDGSRDHPGAPNEGQKDCADAQSHHVHVVPSSLLQLVLSRVDKPDGNVLIEIDEDEPQETSQDSEGNAMRFDVSEVHEPGSLGGSERCLEEASFGHTEKVKVHNLDAVVTDQGPCDTDAEDDGDDRCEVGHSVPDPLVEQTPVSRVSDAQGNEESQKTHEDASFGLTVRDVSVGE